MVLLTTILDDVNLCGMLAEFKQYASVPDDARDAMLTTILKAAIMRVQERADRNIVKCSHRVTYTDVQKGEELRLFLNAKEIIDVQDAKGNDIGYERDGEYVKVNAGAPMVSIDYTGEPEGDVTSLKAVLWRYATALYDGEDTKTLDDILKEVDSYA